MRAIKAGIILVAVLFLLGYGSMPVRIRRVSVQGVQHMTRGAVVKIVDVDPGAMIGPADVRRIEMTLRRHPAFAQVSVSRGLTGTLHVRVRERLPVAWLVDRDCAVAEDGFILPHVRNREAGWIRISGFTPAGGRVCEAGMIRDAICAETAARDEAFPGGGVWRRSSAGAPGWEWNAGGKKIQMTFPVERAGFVRLARFRRGYPEAFAQARLIDVRYAERVVVKR
jgi:hypothetical protein